MDQTEQQHDGSVNGQLLQFRAVLFFFLVIWPMCFGKLRLDFIFQVCYMQVVILTISIGNRLMNLGPTPCQLDNCIAHYVQ